MSLDKADSGTYPLLGPELPSFIIQWYISDHPKSLPETYFTAGSLKLGGLLINYIICTYNINLNIGG